MFIHGHHDFTAASWRVCIHDYLVELTLAVRERVLQQWLRHSQATRNVIQLIGATCRGWPENYNVTGPTQSGYQLHPRMRNQESSDVHMCAHELHELVRVATLFRAQVGIVHVVYNASNRFAVMFLAECGPPLLRGFLEISFRVHYFVPFLCKFATAVYYDDGSPRICV